MSSRTWFELLSDEDMAFVKRFLVASGSLKQVAKQYGVTYPTIRLRLDRLIGKIEALDQDSQASDFERLLRAQFADQKLSQETFRLLLGAHHEEQENSNDQPESV